MEPQLVDYYNELPSGINVIDKMNEELAELQKENAELKKENKLLDKYRQPYFKVNTVEEYNEFSESFNRFKNNCRKILNDEDNGLIKVFEAGIHPILQHRDMFIRYIRGNHELEYKSYPEKFPNITDKLIEELNRATKNKNKEWCSYRVNTSLKEVLSHYTDEEVYTLDIDEIIDFIVDAIDQFDFGDNNVGLPDDKHRTELWCNFKPEELWNSVSYCVYYDCKKCGVESSWENSLLCVDCSPS